MTFTLSFGWWIAPCVLTVLLLGGWRVFGVRMQRNNGGIFPDAFGALAELSGYFVAILVSAIIWLVWVLLTY